MKLIRCGAPGSEIPGVELADGSRVDCRAFGADWDGAFFGSDGVERLSRWIESPENRARRLPSDARLGPAVARPTKIVCVGRNYVEHAREMGSSPPEEPVLFFKSTSAIAGPADELVMPRGATKVDWEIELGVVIGRAASYVSVPDALAHVAGYVLHIDYSERAFQKDRGGQWVKGKSCDTFAPIGPFLATRAEVPDPQNLNLRLEVNGVQKQASNTAQMIFSVAELVSYISQFMTLLPGDLVSTGTPGGVGMGFDPPQYLAPGDVVTSAIERLGSQRQVVVAAR
ncbi:MAG: fumarylacetoacetate hydrolase family protein [Planctomycetes bacterium]|nr:fumarylacetoacetate hydrolase family protein [Planctomycetota bacterium]